MNMQRPRDTANGRALMEQPEGRILAAGLALALLSLCALVAACLRRPEQSQVLVGMTATHVLFGRAAGMSYGYAMGLGHALVIAVNMVIETVMVLVVYPLFVFSWRRLVVSRFLSAFMDATQRAAERHEREIRRYGALGIFLFVWFPFWMTGPVVGCVLGFLMGLRPRVNLAAVLSGTYVAIVCWALVLGKLHRHASQYGPLASFGLLAVIIAVVVGLHLWRRVAGSRRHGGGDSISEEGKQP